MKLEDVVQISFKHVPLWCLFFDLHVTTRQSNICICLRKVTRSHLHVRVSVVVSYVSVVVAKSSSSPKMNASGAKSRIHPTCNIIKEVYPWYASSIRCWLWISGS